MVLTIPDNGSKVGKMALGASFGLTKVLILATLLTTTSKDMASMFGWMGENLMEIGKTIKWKVMESSLGLMVVNMKEVTSMIREKAKVFFIGPMEADSRANGLMESTTEKAFTPILKDKQRKERGKMESFKVGLNLKKRAKWQSFLKKNRRWQSHLKKRIKRILRLKKSQKYQLFLKHKL